MELITLFLCFHLSNKSTMSQPPPPPCMGCDHRGGMLDYSPKLQLATDFESRFSFFFVEDQK